MITVEKILPDVQRMLGQCSDAAAYAALNEAQELLANSGQWYSLVKQLDICAASSDCVSLPPFVEAPLAVTIGDVPATFQNQWFRFGLSSGGPSDGALTAWEDIGEFPTFRDPDALFRLYALSDVDENGASIQVRGRDLGERRIHSTVAGQDVDYVEIPISTTKDVQGTYFKRIDSIQKPITARNVKLIAVPDSGSEILIGDYEPRVTVPSYRRVRFQPGSFLGGSLVRMKYRHRLVDINGPKDTIPLNSPTALKLAVKAIKFYEADLLDNYEAFRVRAVEALQREEKTHQAPGGYKLNYKLPWSKSGNMI